MPKPKPKDTWFLKERSEAIACLMLTERKGIRVRSEREKDDGVDLLVELGEEGAFSTRHLFVQVKGILSFDEPSWQKSVQSLFKTNPKAVSLPACIFVVNVRDNTAKYAWLAEPLIEDQSARLQFASEAKYHDLSQEIVATILDQVEQWYDVLHHQLVTRNSG